MWNQMFTVLIMTGESKAMSGSGCSLFYTSIHPVQAKEQQGEVEV
jgi:hypothetical protein